MPRHAGLAAVLVLVAVAATACGSAQVTPTPAITVSASPTVAATPSRPTLPPSNPAIVPVPTPVFSAPPEAPVLDSALAEKLQKILDEWRAGSKVPGASAAFLFPDGEVWSGASGVAIAGSVPATARTIYSAGSITKTFVAALILRLVERGKLTLDDPLSGFVPDFPNAARITIRELMNHTSGVEDLFSDPKIAEAILAEPARRWTPAEVLGMIGKPYFEPGAGYHYSNTNYLLLGLVIEKLTGTSLATAVRTEFLTPLGLDDTFMQVQEPIRGSPAHGYMGSGVAPKDVTTGSEMLPFNAEVTAAGASGELASTAPDLARWAAALYEGGVLDQATIASMTDVSGTSPYHPRFQYGLGFEEWSLGGQTAWGHRGHLDGFWSSMAYLPKAHVVVVIMANGEWADTLTPSAAMVSAVLATVAAPPATTAPSSSASPEGSTPSPAAP